MNICTFIFKVQSGLSITKIKQNENSNKLYQNLKQSLLDKMMGIKYLIKLLFKLKKPLVGHNCALDILILCNQFFRPLPGNSNLNYTIIAFVSIYYASLIYLNYYTLNILIF